jgi:hypothetical protein
MTQLSLVAVFLNEIVMFYGIIAGSVCAIFFNGRVVLPESPVKSSCVSSYVGLLL